MADYDFPPLLQGEGPSLDAASILQAQNAGNWARTFGEHGAGKNNLMTRKRHNADIERETQVNQQAQEQQLRSDIQTKKTHQDLYFRSKKFELDKRNADATLELREQTFNHKEQMLPVELEAKKAATNAALARETSTTQGTLLKARVDERLSQHTTGFQDAVGRALDSGVEIGSREYREAVAKARLQYPGADKAYADDIWKTTGSGMSLDDAVAQHETAMKEAGQNTTVTTKLPGGGTMTDRPSADEAKALQARYDKFVLQRARTTDKNVKTFLDGEITEMKSRMSGFEKGLIAPVATPAAAPVERTVVNPTTGERLVLRNGAWVKP